jgi:hypothetical protein
MISPFAEVPDAPLAHASSDQTLGDLKVNDSIKH